MSDYRRRYVPGGDADYSARWNHIKRQFTLAWQAAGADAGVVTKDRRRGVWQPRFWDHAIRDEQDYEDHFDYIHFNPVKHGYVRCPHEWQWSSFHRHVRASAYDHNWCCQGDQREDFLRRIECMGKRMGE